MTRLLFYRVKLPGKEKKTSQQTTKKRMEKAVKLMRAEEDAKTRKKEREGESADEEPQDYFWSDCDD